MGLTTRNYDILTRLAVGNGALVYRAVDKVTHRQVALKLLVQDGNVDHRFNAEAVLADAPRLKQITGAHVCQLLEVIPDEEGPVLVYELAQGVSGLEAPAQRRLEAGQAIDVAAQIISALRSGERQKTPHGDVKPSNVIFLALADGRPFTLVLDWALTAYRTVAADDTLPYLAPERLGGAAASHRADLFSAGATLFYLCTGKALIAAKTRTEAESAWQALLPTLPAVLAELRPDLPVKFIQWLCSLLEMSPEKRPESAVDALVPLAALNPPPPPVPPENFRPRPAPPRANLPIASGIVKPPPQPVRPPSSIRKPPPASSGVSAAAKPAAGPAAAPVKKSHVAMTLGLFVFFIAMIAGTVWFLFFRHVEVAKYPGDESENDVRSVSTAAARTPAPSVGQNIATPTPVQKPVPPDPKAATAKSDPKQKQKQKKKAPAPTPISVPDAARLDAAVPPPAAK